MIQNSKWLFVIVRLVSTMIIPGSILCVTHSNCDFLCIFISQVARLVKQGNSFQRSCCVNASHIQFHVLYFWIRILIRQISSTFLSMSRRIRRDIDFVDWESSIIQLKNPSGILEYSVTCSPDSIFCLDTSPNFVIWFSVRFPTSYINWRSISCFASTSTMLPLSTRRRIGVEVVLTRFDFSVTWELSSSMSQHCLWDSGVSDWYSFGAWMEHSSSRYCITVFIDRRHRWVLVSFCRGLVSGMRLLVTFSLIIGVTLGNVSSQLGRHVQIFQFTVFRIHDIQHRDNGKHCFLVPLDQTRGGRILYFFPRLGVG